MLPILSRLRGQEDRVPRLRGQRRGHGHRRHAGAARLRSASPTPIPVYADADVPMTPIPVPTPIYAAAIVAVVFVCIKWDSPWAISNHHVSFQPGSYSNKQLLGIRCITTREGSLCNALFAQPHARKPPR